MCSDSTKTTICPKNVTWNHDNLWSIFSIRARIGSVTSCTCTDTVEEHNCKVVQRTFGFSNRLRSLCERSPWNVLRELIHIPNTQTRTTSMWRSLTCRFSSIVTIPGLNCSRLLHLGQRWEEILFGRKHFLECLLTRKEKRDTLNCCDLEKILWEMKKFNFSGARN